MEKHAKGITYCFLNRMMQTESKNPDKINPTKIIRKFFDLESLSGIKNLFLKCCKAALADKYSWKEGSPGKLLYFYEQLELLIEACYLIYIKKGFKGKLPKTDGSLINGEKNNKLEFTSTLSLEEFMNPRKIIKDFFELRSLLEWKKIMHFWLEAALSNFSIIDNIEPEELLEYYSHMEKILEASYRIAFQAKNSNS